jgi:hypothetical protein
MESTPTPAAMRSRACVPIRWKHDEPEWILPLSEPYLCRTHWDKCNRRVVECTSSQGCVYCRLQQTERQSGLSSTVSRSDESAFITAFVAPYDGHFEIQEGDYDNHLELCAFWVLQFHLGSYPSPLRGQVFHAWREPESETKKPHMVRRVLNKPSYPWRADDTLDVKLVLDANWRPCEGATVWLEVHTEKIATPTIGSVKEEIRRCRTSDLQ